VRVFTSRRGPMRGATGTWVVTERPSGATAAGDLQTFCETVIAELGGGKQTQRVCHLDVRSASISDHQGRCLPSRKRTGHRSALMAELGRQ